MPGPSAFMKTAAARWHTSATITITEVISSTDVDPNTLQPSIVVGYTWTGGAVIQQETGRGGGTNRVPNPTVDQGVTDLTVGVDADAAPQAGYIVTIDASDDPTLVGKAGHIETVDRHDLRARRRFLLRLDNTT